MNAETTPSPTRHMNEAGIALTVLGGHHGAGKTTLLNHILRESGPTSLAVLVGDAGGVAIDARLVHPRRGQRSRPWKCDTHRRLEEFGTALGALRDQTAPPERVVVEASGVSDLRRVAQWGHLPGFRLDGTVIVVDVASVRAQAADPRTRREVVQQLRSADLVVMNKVDLVSDAERELVRCWLDALLPRCRIVATVHGRLPAALVWHRHQRDDARLQRRDDAVAPADDWEDRRRGPRYASWTWTARQPVDETMFRRWAQTLDDEVLRAKGVLFLRQDPHHRFVFQLVGSRWSLRRDAPWARTMPCSQLAAVGYRRRFDPDRLGATITRCLVRSAATRFSVASAATQSRSVAHAPIPD